MPITRPNTSPSIPLSPPLTPSPPQSPILQPLNPRPSFNILNLEAGCIVWLPRKDLHFDSSSSSSDGRKKGKRSIWCIRKSCCGNAALEEEGYNHPVVVLKTSKYHLGDKICFVAKITSQDHNDRIDRLPISQEAPSASSHSPTSNSHSDTNGSSSTTTELYLENSAKMNKQSYILLQHIFQLRASYLRSCSFRAGSRATDTRLREESYARLMSRLRLQRGVWIHTPAAVCEVSAPSPGSIPRSRTTRETRRARRSRMARGGRIYADAPAAVARRQSLPAPRTPQSARVERAVRQVPNQSAAAAAAGVYSPVYMSSTHHYPNLGYGAAPRMPGAWDNAGLQVGGGGRGMRRHDYGSAYDQGGRFERWQSEPPGGEDEENRAGFYAKVVVVSLAAVGVLCWMWYRR